MVGKYTFGARPSLMPCVMYVSGKINKNREHKQLARIRQSVASSPRSSRPYLMIFGQDGCRTETRMGKEEARTSIGLLCSRTVACPNLRGEKAGEGSARKELRGAFWPPFVPAEDDVLFKGPLCVLEAFSFGLLWLDKSYFRRD